MIILNWINVFLLIVVVLGVAIFAMHYLTKKYVEWKEQRKDEE